MKPILFSTEMVQAILNGRKTQTRRIVKNNLAVKCLEYGFVPEYVTDHGNSFMHDWPLPGEVLWVRVSFNVISHLNPKGTEYEYHYKTDMGNVFKCWKPSIHMPKDACRLFLKIKKIRVERLHNISESDAVAEGVELHERGKHWLNYTDKKHGLTQFIYNCHSAYESFKSLWMLIHGFRDEEFAWFKNPWVWVIEFEVTEKQSSF